MESSTTLSRIPLFVFDRMNNFQHIHCWGEPRKTQIYQGNHWKSIRTKINKIFSFLIMYWCLYTCPSIYYSFEMFCVFLFHHDSSSSYFLVCFLSHLSSCKVSIRFHCRQLLMSSTFTFSMNLFSTVSQFLIFQFFLKSCPILWCLLYNYLVNIKELASF